MRMIFGVKNVSIARSFIPVFSVSSESVALSGNKTFYYSKVPTSQILPNFTGTEQVCLAVMLPTCIHEMLGLNISQDLNYPACSFFWGFSPGKTTSVIQWSEFLVTDPEVWVRFPALPDFLSSSGSGTGSTQPCELLKKKKRRKRKKKSREPKLWP
jgi:hypothetical protein